MKIFKLYAPAKLLSVNKAFIGTKNGARVMSPDYRLFRAEIYKLIQQKRKEFDEFNNFYDYFKHEIHAGLRIGISDLYTKDGRISKTSGDIPNFEKALIDSILVGKIDDSQITSWEMVKYFSEVNEFTLELKILER